MSTKLKLYKRTCPACDQNSFKYFYNYKNFRRMDGNGKIYVIDKYYVVCKNCNLIYTNPTVDPVEFDKIYKKTIIGSFRNLKKTKSNLKKLKYFTDLVPRNIVKNKNILDIGCGQGELIRNIKTKFNLKYKNIFAIEPSRKIYLYLKKKKIINVKNLFLDQLKNNKKFDFIILDNVFEHFDFPNKSLKKINEILNENGHLYISVPNALKPHFEYEDPLNHTCNYYFRNINDLLSKNNFKVLKIKTEDNLLNLLAKKENNLKKIKSNFNIDKKLFYNLQRKIFKSLKLFEKKNKKIKKIGQQIIKQKLKLIIFGSGNYSLELLTKLGIRKNNVLGYVDSNILYQGKVRNGYKVYSLKNLKKMKFDKVVISSKKFMDEIYNLLIKNSIPKKKIITIK